MPDANNNNNLYVNENYINIDTVIQNLQIDIAACARENKIKTFLIICIICVTLIIIAMILAYGGKDYLDSGYGSIPMSLITAIIISIFILIPSIILILKDKMNI